MRMSGGLASTFKVLTRTPTPAMMVTSYDNAFGVVESREAPVTRQRADDFGRRLTIAQIAKLAGVSTPTVSRVLNGRPDVSDATRALVKRVVTEQGYVRNSAARALGAGRTGLVDLVALELNSPYIAQIIGGVEKTLEAAGFAMVLTVTHDGTHCHRHWLSRVTAHAPDGAILVLPDGHTEGVKRLRRESMPFVSIDDHGDRLPDIPSVGTTNFAGGLTATEYLLSLGHRCIAAIDGLPYGCTRARLAGYRAALHEAGLSNDPWLVQPGDFSVEAGYAATLRLLDSPNAPTAIFAGNDLQALGVYKALHARGLRVPDDMSVVGFDDVPLADLIMPGLTTVRQPMREMGAHATRMLTRLITGENLESIHVELATSLVVRESCAPPAARGRRARMARVTPSNDEYVYRLSAGGGMPTCRAASRIRTV